MPAVIVFVVVLVLIWPISPKVLIGFLAGMLIGRYM